MQVIIPLGGYGTRMRPHTWSRPKPLVRVAGQTVLGHILDRLAPVTSDEVIFVVGYKGAQIEAWVRENYPQLDAHFVVQEQALGQAHAVWLCREFLGEKDVVVSFGDGVVDADFAAIPTACGQEADGVFLVKEVENPHSFGVVVPNRAGWIERFIEKPKVDTYRQAIAGVYWFRRGEYLRTMLDRVISEGHQTLGEYYLADAFQLMLKDGGRLGTMKVKTWLDVGKPDNALDTNRRLLATDAASPGALERSYEEGFTVLPPVYLHPTAVIDAAVVGPYVSVEAGATIRSAIVRNSVIDAGALIEDCVLDGALVGENAVVRGHPKALFIGDDSQAQVG